MPTEDWGGGKEEKCNQHSDEDIIIAVTCQVPPDLQRTIIAAHSLSGQSTRQT